MRRSVLAILLLAVSPAPIWAKAQLPTFITSVSGGSFSPNGKLLLVVYSMSGGSSFGGSSISVVDLETGKELRQLEGVYGPCGPTSFAFLPDNRHILLISSDRCPPGRGKSDSLRLVDVQNGKDVRVFDRPGTEYETIRAIAASPDGKRALAGYANGKVRLWDVETGKLLKTLESDQVSPVCAVAISPDNKQALSGGNVSLVGSALTHWDLAEDKALRTYGNDDSVMTPTRWGSVLAFTKSGKYAITDRYLCSVKDNKLTEVHLALWETGTGKVIRVFECQPSAAVFRSDDKQLVATHRDPDGSLSIKTWNVENGKETGERQIYSKPRAPDFSDLTHAALSPDGTLLMTAAGSKISGSRQWDSLTIKVWDAMTGKEILTLREPEKSAASEHEKRLLPALPK